MLSAIKEAANPYMLWIKIGAAALLLVTIIGIFLYIKSVFKERDSLLQDKVTLSGQLEEQAKQTRMISEQLDNYITLNKDIANAIRKIKIQSDVYIEGVENGPVPEPDSNGVVPFIAGGVPKTMPTSNSLPSKPNGFANRTSASTP